MLTRGYPLMILLGGSLAVWAQPEEKAPPEKSQPPAPKPAVETPKAEDPPPPAKAKEAKESKPLPDRGTILKNLRDEDYKKRVAAQEALFAWGMKDLDRGIETLYHTYRTTDDPEVRLRSRAVLKRLVIIQQPFEGSGYLGIQMEEDQWKNGAGRLQPAVRITVVREGTAAELAKLQANDLVIGVDDVVFRAEPTQEFAEYIQSKAPGDEITLHIQRGDEAMKIKASLRRRSPLLNRLTQWGTLPVLPPQAELDETDFRDWLKQRTAEERKRAKDRK